MKMGRKSISISFTRDYVFNLDLTMLFWECPRHLPICLRVLVFQQKKMGSIDN